MSDIKIPKNVTEFLTSYSKITGIEVETRLAQDFRDELIDTIKPSEVSIWTGWSGHGKSTLLGQVITAGVCQGEKVCIASFEMRPKKTLGRIIRQISRS